MTSAELAAIIREHTAQVIPAALASLLEHQKALELRILELETRPAVVGPAGPVGAKGDPGTGIASVVISADGRLLAHLTDGRSLDVGPVPKGEKGDPGEPGVRGEPGPRGEAGPMGPGGPPGPVGARGEKGDLGERGPQGDKGADGLPGRDGAPGERGPQGDKGLDGRDGAPGERGPQGEKGVDGLPGRDGAPGERGPQGEKGVDGLHGRDGRDGIPGAPGAPGEKGLDGRDGINGMDGKDGRDGLGFDDFDLFLDETRGWILRLAQGERVKDTVLPIPFFTGNWEAGRTYPKGAGVRWDGHYWWALAQTHEQPGEGSAHWQIVVSRGKQGREGKQGKDGAPGRDLTQMDPATGRKW